MFTSEEMTCTCEKGHIATVKRISRRFELLRIWPWPTCFQVSIWQKLNKEIKKTKQKKYKQKHSGLRHQIFMSFLCAFAYLRICRTKREIKYHDKNSGASETQKLGFLELGHSGRLLTCYLTTCRCFYRLGSAHFLITTPEIRTATRYMSTRDLRAEAAQVLKYLLFWLEVFKTVSREFWRIPKGKTSKQVICHD